MAIWIALLLMGLPQQGTGVRYLAPAAFTELPAAARASVDGRGCGIPQWWGESQRHNVIAGAFTAAGRAEWAILCSVRDTSQILIVDDRTGAVIDSLERSADARWMQGIGGGRTGYSRRLNVLPRARIARVRTDGGRRPIPQPIDHDAINQAFVEKSATALYLAGGMVYRWITAD